MRSCNTTVFGGPKSLSEDSIDGQRRSLTNGFQDDDWHPDSPSGSSSLKNEGQSRTMPSRCHAARGQVFRFTATPTAWARVHGSPTFTPTPLACAVKRPTWDEVANPNRLATVWVVIATVIRNLKWLFVCLETFRLVVPPARV